jgi:hypothetical protein
VLLFVAHASIQHVRVARFALPRVTSFSTATAAFSGETVTTGSGSMANISSNGLSLSNKYTPKSIVLPFAIAKEASRYMSKSNKSV